MRRAGRVVAEMHEACIRAARPGATTADLDRWRATSSTPRGARSNFLGYHGYPAVDLHSPQRGRRARHPRRARARRGRHRVDRLRRHRRRLARRCGVHVPVGEIDDESQRLIDVTRAVARRRRSPRSCRAPARRPRRGGARRAVERAGFTRGAGYVGHGIGTAMHEEPDVPNYGPPGRGLKLGRGRLAIEPMVNAGRRHDPPARRRLDGRDRRRVVRRALRAHRRRHRRRPRDPHPALTGGRVSRGTRAGARPWPLGVCGATCSVEDVVAEDDHPAAVHVGVGQPHLAWGMSR